MALPDFDTVRPTVRDVSLLEASRTGSGRGLGSSGGADSMFTDTTTPSASDVESLIDLALNLIVPQVGPAYVAGTPLDGQIKSAVSLQAAILVEGSFFREQLDEGSVSLWTATIARLMSNVTALTGGTSDDGSTGGGDSGGTGNRVWTATAITPLTYVRTPILDNLP